MTPPRTLSLGERVARHAALADPIRLAIVDDLAESDRSPVELGHRLGVGSNLLSHHLDVLEEVGLVVRRRSAGDGRRRYVQLRTDTLVELGVRRRPRAGAALFVCTHNSARSQLAAAIWRKRVGSPAESAGTHPAERVHPGAVAAARRVRLDLGAATPRHVDQVRRRPALVVTVCDQAHEELEQDDSWLHWSIIDPVPTGTKTAFDAVVVELDARISALINDGGRHP